MEHRAQLLLALAQLGGEGLRLLRLLLAHARQHTLHLVALRLEDLPR